LWPRIVIFEFMKQIILSVTNDLVTDQRVHRVATSLMKAGAQITLVGRLLPDSQPVKREYETHRMKLLFKKSALFYAEYNVRLFFYLLFKKVDILVANDLDTLLANYAVSVIRRKTLMYDSHELFTEVPELIGRSSTKKFWETIESWLLPKIRHSYTVCQSIADWHNRKYGTDMKVVRNLPVRCNHKESTNPYPGLPQTDFVLYQGSVNKGRGLEALVDSFEFINDIKCVIAGDGDIMDALVKRIEKKNLTGKIILLGKIPFEDLKRITPYAKLGLSIEENTGLNYYYALPNKLFDYIQAGIPVLASDFPEMTNIVVSYRIGELLLSHHPRELAGQIKRMVEKGKDSFWKNSLEEAAKELCWEEEEIKLWKIYG
jgi:glycosyltransferase involved in cell wall biosynthesis